jgi:hypothetical protein
MKAITEGIYSLPPPYFYLLLKILMLFLIYNEKTSALTGGTVLPLGVI